VPCASACHDVVVTGTHGQRAVVPLLIVSGVVVLVVWGLGRGIWLSNLHNGVLALALTLVGAYVLFQRPGHREGRLFMAAGTVEAIMFLGRQEGRSPGGGIWWGWLGVWPVAVGLALTTLAVILFPDGRLPSSRWRWMPTVVVAVAVGCAGMSALWPVEYASTGVATEHPLSLGGGAAAAAVWTVVAHPAYAALQLLWVPAVVVRWRSSGGLVRVQLAWVALAACVSAAALVAGLVGWGTPRLGLLTAGLVPIAAGWAIVHGQHLAAYSALSWLSRTGAASERLPADLARAVAEALAAPRAAVWIGDSRALYVGGEWPEGGDGSGPVSLAALRETPQRLVRPVTTADGTVIGAIDVDRPADRLSLAQERLVDDLVAQAVLVIEHLTLFRGSTRQPPGDLARLSPREHQVLELIARGLSNAAICQELHLSIKTVEPIIGAIFTKLGLDADSANNRRVLAVRAFLRA
jgi:DNA-binding CsgD family transcriptional regulator